MHVSSTPLSARARSLQLVADDGPLSWDGVLHGLRADPALRLALTDALRAGPPAIYWEARPVSPADRAAPFACVVLDAPELAAVRADGGPFARPLAGARAPAVRAFPNLGGDAQLVVPAPGDHPEGYPHLGAFLRRAPATQIDALWLTLADAVEGWLATRGTRVWVSTAGLGVSWLHVRLDSRPKYVKWRPYRES